MIGIYKITSPSNKVYIGQSVDIFERWKSYLKNNGSKNQPALHKSFKKHGVENHKFEIIEECFINELNNRERYWQEYYDVLSENGLNCLLTKSDSKSGVMSKDTVLKKSISVRKEKHWCWGKKRPDTSERMIANNPMSDPKIRDLVSRKLKGKKHSEETKRKISESNKGRGSYVGSYNCITNECVILNLKETASYLGVDTELIRNRCNNTRRKKTESSKDGKLRKLTEWSFRFIYKK